jgi:hypothetical protein
MPRERLVPWRRLTTWARPGRSVVSPSHRFEAVRGIVTSRPCPFDGAAVCAVDRVVFPTLRTSGDSGLRGGASQVSMLR